MSSSAIFQVVDASQLDAERDVFLGLPVENNNKQTFHRVPVRSSCTEFPGDERRTVRVQLLPGSPNVVQGGIQGLRRLLLRFPQSYCPGVRVYEGEGGDGDRRNRSLGFALYDQRAGPTPEETRVQQNLDRLAAFVRTTMLRCERIRTTLKLGPANMSAQQQQVAADMMDLWVARPAADDKRGRYCYTKLVTAESNAPEKFHTFFWTPDGRRLPLSVVEGYRNFQVVPFVEVEDIFVSKALRSMQLKLRECIVHPPAERASTRFSVCFPDRLCADDGEDAGPAAPGAAAEEAAVEAAPAPAAEEGEPATKRPRESEEEAVEPESEPAAKRPHVSEDAEDVVAAQDEETEEEEEDDA